MKKYLLTLGLITFLGLASFVEAKTEEGPVDLLIDPSQETQEEPVDIADNIAEETESSLVDNQIQEELINPGLLPGHPLYFLKSISERLGDLFTFGETNQAQRAIMLAEKRLAENQALIAQGETALAEQAINRYQEQLTHAFTFAQRAKEKGQNTDEVMAKIAENTLRHQAVLSRVYEQVPEEAKPAIEQAMENSLRGHEQALENISQERSDKVNQILERIEKKQPAVEEKINQLQEQGVPIQNLSPRSQNQDESNNSLLEINQANQEQTAKEAQTQDGQAEGQGELIQIQEQVQEKTQRRIPAASQQ